MNKSCASCGKYPFCEKIVKPTGWCGDWCNKEYETFKEVKNAEKGNISFR